MRLEHRYGKRCADHCMASIVPSRAPRRPVIPCDERDQTEQNNRSTDEQRLRHWTIPLVSRINAVSRFTSSSLRSVRRYPACTSRVGTKLQSLMPSLSETSMKPLLAATLMMLGSWLSIAAACSWFDA